MVTKNLVNIGPGNGLLPDLIKPLPDPVYTNYQCGSAAFIWVISQEMPKIFILDMSLKITKPNYSHNFNFNPSMDK